MKDSLKTEKKDAAAFYRAVWRWHFYAGLLVVPLMIVLSVTGIIYLFKPQTDALLHGDRMFVEPNGSAAPAAEMLETVRRDFPDAAVLKFRPNWEADRSAEFDVAAKDGRELKVFVDPYRNRVLGTLDNKNNLQYYAFEIHGKLMTGRFGEWLIELGVCWGLVLLVTGICLWFPRGNGFPRGVLVPRLSLKNRRVFWRDLHAVTGFYGLLLVAFMIFTGLPWTDFWGKNVFRVRESYPLAGKKPPKSIVPMSALDVPGEKQIPWAVEEMPLAASDAEHHEHAPAANGGETNPNAAAPLDLTRVLALARALGAPADSVIALPQTPDGVYAITAFPNDPALQTTIHLDRYSGAVLTDVRWKDYRFWPKTVEMGIALHEGRYFGVWNQLVMLCAALCVLVLAISGTMMWWRRRPAGSLGAPPLPEDFPRRKTVFAVIGTMSVVFPLVGASLVAALVFDYLLIQKIPALKRALG